MDFPGGLYCAVDIGLRIGYTIPNEEESSGSMIFSMIFMMFGIFLFALIDRNVFRGNCAKTDHVRLARLLLVSILIVTWIVIGVLWGSLSMELSIINSFYNSVSSMWAWGIYSLPLNLSDGEYILASFYNFFGMILVFFFYSYTASEIDVLIEKYILTNAAMEPFSEHEWVYLKQRRHLNGVSELSTEALGDSQEQLLNYEEVKEVILRRVRDVDVSCVYRMIRSWLPLFYFAFVLLALFFYKYYGDSESWSIALNCTLSSW